MTKDKATATWTKVLPTMDGDYYSRIDEYDKSPTLIRIEAGKLFEFGCEKNLSAEYQAEAYEYLGPITPDLFAEVAELRAEALKGICVYCGYIEQYESLEQKASEEGNAMRVAHIRQCEARPELKLIAYAEELQTVLRAAKDALRSYEYGNASPDLAKAIADKADEALTPH